MAVPDRVDLVIGNAELQANLFLMQIAAAEQTFVELVANQWVDLQAGPKGPEAGMTRALEALTPAMIRGDNLAIEPDVGQPLAERQTAAHARLAGGFAAFQAVIACLDTPLNPLDPTSTPRLLLNRMRR